jgi:hypothetical protein
VKVVSDQSFEQPPESRLGFISSLWPAFGTSENSTHSLALCVIGSLWPAFGTFENSTHSLAPTPVNQHPYLKLMAAKV